MKSTLGRSHVAIPLPGQPPPGRAPRTGRAASSFGRLEPVRRHLLSATGDARLATAGTGDVLSGVIGAFLAQGLGAVEAAAAGAWVHGTAAHLGWRRGLVAGDLLDLIPAVLSDL